MLKKGNKLFRRLQLSRLRRLRGFFKYRGRLSYWGRFYFRQRLHEEKKDYYDENLESTLFEKIDLFEQKQMLAEEQYFDLLSTNVTYYVHKLKDFEWEDYTDKIFFYGKYVGWLIKISWSIIINTRYEFAWPIIEEFTFILKKRNVIIFSFKRKSFFLTLLTKQKSCILTLSTGLFIPDYKALKRSRFVRKEMLKHKRSLKKKEKRKLMKKHKVIHWKCARYKKITKLYMIRYFKSVLFSIKYNCYMLYVHGESRYFKKLFIDLFSRRRRITRRHGFRVLHLKNIFFFNKVAMNNSARNIKKRLRHRIHIRSCLYFRRVRKSKKKKLKKKRWTSVRRFIWFVKRSHKRF